MKQGIYGLFLAWCIVGAANFGMCAANTSYAAKSCDQIVAFLRMHAPSPEESSWDCAGARAVPSNASLELRASTWDKGLQAERYVLTCTPSTLCLPFVVLARAQTNPQITPLHAVAPQSASSRGTPVDRSPRRILLVHAGDPASLQWDGASLHVMLKVRCLEGGGNGDTVRVRAASGRVISARVQANGSLRRIS